MKKSYSLIILTLTLTFILLSQVPATNATSLLSKRLKKTSSGKIVYDTFSASDGAATDVPWTIPDDPFPTHDKGTWTVEDGKFKGATDSGEMVCAYPTGIKVTDCVWEVKVYPLLLLNEGPELLFRNYPPGAYPPGQYELAFDYHSSTSVLRLMFHPPTTGGKIWIEVSFQMNVNIWYTMKIVKSGSNVKAYIDDVLKFDVIDSELESMLQYSTCLYGFSEGEAGYYDDVKIWKTNIITITGLQEGQKVELYDNTNALKTSDTVGIDETQATLDVSSLSFPFKGHFKVYASNGVTLLHTTSEHQDIWGGDEYNFVNRYWQTKYLITSIFTMLEQFFKRILNSLSSWLQLIFN